MTLEDRGEGQGDKTNSNMNEQSPAQYAEFPLRENIKVEQEKGHLCQSYCVLHHTLKYEKVEQRVVLLFWAEICSMVSKAPIDNG